MVELYIEGKKIDLTEDIQIDFTYESLDPDKLSSIKNSFSKTVDVPGTPANNITFGHIFRFDKYISVGGPSNIDTWYDPHKKVDWYINRNGTLINRGYCTLNSIVVKSERDITYKLTLYGGIGEFFYALSYNEDGTPKTLKDIFFDWRPKTSPLVYGDPMDPSVENTQTLMTCSAEIVARSYRSLRPNYTYEGTTDIDKDVVMVPAYTGMYENFDSKHMLVTTFNQNYLTIPSIMTASTRNALKTAFPDTYSETVTEDGQTVTHNYSTIGSALSPSDPYKYGIVTFSRDVDPSEIGDLRTNELPVALRLSKLLHRISDPSNNGGYTVEWDDSIKDSYYWNYGWVLLGKMKQELDEISAVNISRNTTYDGQKYVLAKRTTNGSMQNATTNISSATTEYNLSADATTLASGSYRFSVNIIPHWSVQFGEKTHDDYGCGSMWSKTWHEPVEVHPNIWYEVWYNRGTYTCTFSVLIHRICNGSTIVKTLVDLFYYNYEPLNVMIENAKSYVTANYLSASEIPVIRLHKVVKSDPATTPVMISGQVVGMEESYDGEPVYVTTNFSTGGQDFNNFYVKQTQKCIVTYYSYNNKTGTNVINSTEFTGVTTPRSYVACYKHTASPLGMLATNGGSGTILSNQDNLFKFWFTLNEDSNNGIYLNSATGFNILELTKDKLFSNSSSPMKYLTDFAKLLNLKFLCDNTSKVVRIYTPQNFYYLPGANTIAAENATLDGKIDLNRNLEVKPVVTNYKKINIGLPTPETYPVKLFNKLGKDKFNTYRFDTGVEYNVSEKDELTSSIYKNVIDWQQSSVYHNIYPQFPRPYDVPSISWTLFDSSAITADQLVKKEFFTRGVNISETDVSETTDFYPKPALFNENDKEASDAFPTLLFLNGFVKNYDYVKTADGATTELTPNSINESHFVGASGEVNSTSYQDIYKYNVVSGYTYYVTTGSFSSGYSSYVVNYMNANNVRIGYEYLQTSNQYTNALLHIPAGTVQIWCNFKKADLSVSKLTAVSPGTYTIAPKVMFSNDTIEQYYLNGGRCYISDFKYNDTFGVWGCYSSQQKGCATSWVLPFFSKDLYNVYDSSSLTWIPSETKVASWNLTDQEGLDRQYTLMGTSFISNPWFSYSKQTTNIAAVNANEYTFPNVPQDGPETRIYDKYWKGLYDNVYNRNAREVTCYADLSQISDPNEAMRIIYKYKGSYWVITKLHNYRVKNTFADKFTKVTMHRIMDITPFIND